MSHILSVLSESDDDYRGQHTSPDPDSSPMHDVTKNEVYPKDFYSHVGLRHYAPGHDDNTDASSYHKILSVRDKPDEHVRVYRAIPHVDGKKGRDPVTRNSSHIRPGDWVTISKQYAVDHGEAHLNGNYSLSAGMKPARELYTNGDSFHEWGWHPDKKE
jgi:hypothetical protein